MILKYQILFLLQQVTTSKYYHQEIRTMRNILIMLSFFLLSGSTLLGVVCPKISDAEAERAIRQILESKPRKGSVIKYDGINWSVVEEFPQESEKDLTGTIKSITLNEDLSKASSTDEKKICYYLVAFEPRIVWLPFSIEQQQFSMGPIYVGHGIRKKGSLSHPEISVLKQKYAQDEVLSKAFEIIEGADLAVAVDLKTLLDNIKNNPTPIDRNQLYEIMKTDMETITNAALCLESDKNRGPEKVYRPFLDLLHALGNQGKVLGYTGRRGIEHAQELIRKHGDTLEKGLLPSELKAVTSKDSIHLRLALFYINLLKNKLAKGEKIALPELTTFCPFSYEARLKNLEDKLKNTSFYENGRFYAPSNGYVKNAEVCNLVRINNLADADLRWDNKEKIDPLKMLFADCSGFAQEIAKQFHPSNIRLTSERVMSYHLAPLYDVLANQAMNTKNLYYNVDGTTRPLNHDELEQIKKYSKTVADLKGVYEAVINPLENIQAGDLIIERGPGEGHVLIAVEQSPHDKNLIKAIELTSFQGTGYNWTNQMLSSSGPETYRVLRIKRQ